MMAQQDFLDKEAYLLPIKEPNNLLTDQHHLSYYPYKNLVSKDRPQRNIHPGSYDVFSIFILSV